MRSLKNKPGVIAPTAQYPNGRARNDDGSGNGYVVDEQGHGDMLQFFERLMVEAGITPNEIAENAYDGYQLIQALKVLCQPGAWSDITPTGFTATFFKWKSLPGNGFAMKAVVQKTGASGTTFVVGSIPAGLLSILPSLGNFQVPCLAFDGGGSKIDGYLWFDTLTTNTIIFKSYSSLSSVTINLYAYLTYYL